jgi:hypothetical protein
LDINNSTLKTDMDRHNYITFDPIQYCKDRSKRIKEQNLSNPPSIDGSKICGHCKREKPKTEFTRSNNLKCGFSVDCKECQNRFRETKNQHRRINQKNKEYNKQYKKTDAGKITEAKYRNTDKWKITQEKYNNSDKRKMVSIRYAHRRRLLVEENGGDFTLENWNTLCERFGNKCLCCGERRTLTIDHVIPVTLGGRNDIGNLQPLCRICNTKKGQKIIDYRTENGSNCSF